MNMAIANVKELAAKLVATESSPAAVKTFADLKEQLMNAQDPNLSSLAEPSGWDLIIDTVEKCGYDDEDLPQLSNDLMTIGCDKFLASLPTGTLPRALAAMQRFIGLFASMGFVSHPGGRTLSAGTNQPSAPASDAVMDSGTVNAGVKNRGERLRGRGPKTQKRSHLFHASPKVWCNFKSLLEQAGVTMAQLRLLLTNIG